MMSREVGLPFARAVAAFGRGEYATVVDELLPMRGHANRFGGSHAQRDIVHLTLVEAALLSVVTTTADSVQQPDVILVEVEDEAVTESEEA